jgi:quinol monooxygenase YgiN
MAKENRIRVTVGLLVRIEAKPGKEEDVASLLRNAVPIVEGEEPFTNTWFAVRFDPSNFGIFDTFEDNDDRQDHLGGKVAAALANARDLLARPPVIEKFDVYGAKLPGHIVDCGERVAA